MEAGWYRDPSDDTTERFHNGTAWTDVQRDRKEPGQGDASYALLWVASIAASIGLFVGVRPSPNHCGSAWFPVGCSGGGLASAAAVSVVFMLIAGAAIIAAISMRGRKP